ncbi:MAG: UbiA family prenyltransferase [Planctomycetaceae bacterium]
MMKTVYQYLRLCRFPTVFTALPDILMGFLLTHNALEPLSKVIPLLFASAGLYLSGMVFNDYFDVAQDTQERPQRPIPSGAVSRRSALAFGLVLMTGGILCAWLASTASLWIVLMLAASILLYDGPMKRTPLGPLFMGSCRFLNVILGASAAGIRFGSAWQQPQLWIAACMGLYIVGVTLFARRESGTSSKLSLAVALLVAHVGLLGLAAYIMDWTTSLGLLLGAGGVEKPWTVLLLLGAITFTIDRNALNALVDPQPKHVQKTVGLMLLSVIMLDAMLIYFKLGPSGLPYAIGTAALMAPAFLMKKVIPLT